MIMTHILQCQVLKILDGDDGLDPRLQEIVTRRYACRQPFVSSFPVVYS
jgi:hypothetical protein